MALYNLQGQSEMTEKRKRGRPAGNPNNKKVGVCVCLTIEQREKMRSLGGSSWVQEQIDKAKQP